MGMSFKNIGIYIISAKGWLVFVTFMPTIGAFINGLMEGLPISTVILLTVFTLAMSSIFAYYSMVSFVYASNYFGKRKEFNAIADQLQELLDVEHKFLRIEDIAGMWAGEQAENLWLYNPKLRRLKSAVRSGKVKTHNQGNDKVGKKTFVHVEDVIKVFREGDI